MAHPAIVEAAVVAVPDARYGELVGAWVLRDASKPAPSREEVRKTVAMGMNPQVRPHFNDRFLISGLVSGTRCGALYPASK